MAASISLTEDGSLERIEPQNVSIEHSKETIFTNEEKLDSLKREHSKLNSESNKTTIIGLEQSNTEIKRIRISDYSTEVQSKFQEKRDPGSLSINICIECSAKFPSSYLLKSFSLAVCDNCKDLDHKYKLITATEVRQRYLLTDRHFVDESAGKLKFVEKRNPRNTVWSRMKLFLEFQVKEKAYAAWGGEEGMEKEAKRRIEQSHKLKRKKYEKEMKELRATVKVSSAAFKPVSHEHSYGIEELVDAETEEYRKSCTSCGYVLTYEKL